jgi:hypothetical protein
MFEILQLEISLVNRHYARAHFPPSSTISRMSIGRARKIAADAELVTSGVGDTCEDISESTSKDQ